MARQGRCGQGFISNYLLRQQFSNSLLEADRAISSYGHRCWSFACTKGARSTIPALRYFVKRVTSETRILDQHLCDARNGSKNASANATAEERSAGPKRSGHLCFGDRIIQLQATTSMKSSTLFGHVRRKPRVFICSASCKTLQANFPEPLEV